MIPLSQTHTQSLLLCGCTHSMRFLHYHTNVTLHYGFQYKKSHVAEIITGPIIYSETWVWHFALMTGTKCTWQCDGNTWSLQSDYIKVIGYLLLRACWPNGNGCFNVCWMLYLLGLTLSWGILFWNFCRLVNGTSWPCLVIHKINYANYSQHEVYKNSKKGCLSWELNLKAIAFSIN